MTSLDTAVRHEQNLRHLELLVTRKLDGLLQGDHTGLVPGAGTDTGEARVYQPGDDPRRIDWNLTARVHETHVRDTIAERELETWLVVDETASLDFGTARCEKRDLAVSAAAAFAFLTAGSGNRLAALCFDGTSTRLVPPRSGRDAAFALLRRLDQRPRASEGHGSLADALRRARAVAHRRGLLVVISDLLDASDWPAQLRALSRRHEIVVVQITDPREAELPPVGLLTLVDPETGQLFEVQTSKRALRKRYAAAAAEQRARITAAVRSSGARHLVLSTDRDWLLDVVQFVAAQRRRR